MCIRDRFNLKTPSDILGSPIVRLLNPADYLGVMTSGAVSYTHLEQFDKNITELPHAVQSDSYGSAFARLASGQIDVLCKMCIRDRCWTQPSWAASWRRCRPL